MLHLTKFKKSLGPLLVWTKLIGIHLYDEKLIAGNKKKRFIVLYETVCFLLSVAMQTDVLLYLYRNICEFTLLGGIQLKTKTSSWNTIIDLSNYAIHGVGSHFMLLVFVRPRWATLVKCFNRLEFHLDNTFFIRLRRFSWIGLSFILFWVGLKKNTLIAFENN